MNKIWLPNISGFAVVDCEDYERLQRYNWTAKRVGSRWYAVRSAVCIDGKRRVVYMHQQIMGFPSVRGNQVDHVSGDGLDNRRKNLRECSQAQNSRAFCRKRPNTSSSYRGVSFHRLAGKWNAKIMLPGKVSGHLGLFEFEEDAARAYDEAASRLFGEFAQLNFPA